MLQLSGVEMAVFVLVLLVYLVATGLGVLQLLSQNRKCNRFMLPLVALGAILETVLLIFRAVAIKGVPLTGLFESMIVLTIVFSLLYLFLTAIIEQVWFSSVIVWVIFALAVLAGVVAEPAMQPNKVAATPWAVLHGICMILGGASIMLAAAASGLYLLVGYNLKHKRLTQVLGKMPNIEKLENVTAWALKSAFLFISVGFIGGVGLIYMLRTSFSDWIGDPKIICVVVIWVILAAVLILNRLLLLKGRTRAYLTLVAFALVLFAILGVAMLGTTQHRFRSVPSETNQSGSRLTERYVLRRGLTAD